MSFTYKRLDKNDAAVLFVDHQAGLLSLVRDFSPDEFKNNVLALADIARFFNLPTILTTSFEDGPNGPLVPELKEMFPQAPYIARPGNINAWDNEDFVKAVKATGKKQLIIAGVVTDVCVAFPTLSALEEGFDVFVVPAGVRQPDPELRHEEVSRLRRCPGHKALRPSGALCRFPSRCFHRNAASPEPEVPARPPCTGETPWLPRSSTLPSAPPLIA